MSAAGAGTEALTIGRVGVDLYPMQPGVPLSQVTSFRRSLGGTATNVAVAAARLGRRTAVLTKVGPDEFGGYVRAALRGFGVETAQVGTAPGLQTPVVFCALDPPEDPPLVFYRQPKAPDLTLTAGDVPWDLVARVPLLWVTGTGVSEEPARQTQHDILAHRAACEASPAAAPPGQARPARWTVLDLDWRPMFWSSPRAARREYQRMLGRVNVVVGNRNEVEVAVGTADPEEAARRLLGHGAALVLVKQGADGVLVATGDGMTTVPAVPVPVVCGLGAGDAFGGALVCGLLSGWDPVRTARYASASGAIVASRLACADAMPTIEELEEVLAR